MFERTKENLGEERADPYIKMMICNLFVLIFCITFAILFEMGQIEFYCLFFVLIPFAVSGYFLYKFTVATKKALEQNNEQN